MSSVGVPESFADEGPRPSDEGCPLEGLRVVELGDPSIEYCGMVLAGLGAEVIKVEPPSGALSRSLGPFYEDQPGRERSLHYWTYNRSKRSIVLDLADPADQARLEALLDTSDVLL